MFRPAQGIVSQVNIYISAKLRHKIVRTTSKCVLQKPASVSDTTPTVLIPFPWFFYGIPGKCRNSILNGHFVLQPSPIYCTMFSSNHIRRWTDMLPRQYEQPTLYFQFAAVSHSPSAYTTFWPEKLKGRRPLGELGVDVRVSAGLNFLKVVTVADSCEYGSEISGSMR